MAKTAGPPRDGQNVQRDQGTLRRGKTMSADMAKKYWSENVRLLICLLLVWFAVSFGAGILFVDTLNKVQIGGFPLGFWFAQQGSIYTFVMLIFFYTFYMKKIEHRYGIDDDNQNITR